MVSKVASSSHSKGFLHLKRGLFYGSLWRRLFSFFENQHLNFCHLVSATYSIPHFSMNGFLQHFYEYPIPNHVLPITMHPCHYLRIQLMKCLSMSEHYSLLSIDSVLFWEKSVNVYFLSIGSLRLVVGI